MTTTETRQNHAKNHGTTTTDGVTHPKSPNPSAKYNVVNDRVYVIDSNEYCPTHDFSEKLIHVLEDKTVWALITCAKCGYGVGQKIIDRPLDDERWMEDAKNGGWEFIHHEKELFTDYTFKREKDAEKLAGQITDFLNNSNNRITTLFKYMDREHRYLQGAFGSMCAEYLWHCIKPEYRTDARNQHNVRLGQMLEYGYKNIDK
jgi:hypothetical protein